MNRWGVFYSELQNIYPGDMTALSWIGSLWYCLCNITGPIYLWMGSKFDDRYVLGIACITSCLAMMLASITNAVCVSCFYVVHSASYQFLVRYGNYTLHKVSCRVYLHRLYGLHVCVVLKNGSQNAVVWLLVSLWQHQVLVDLSFPMLLVHVLKILTIDGHFVFLDLCSLYSLLSPPVLAGV